VGRTEARGGEAAVVEATTAIRGSEVSSEHRMVHSVECLKLV